METALKLKKGTSDSIEENNRIKTLIKNYFPERDCFVIMDYSSCNKKI